LKYFFGKTRAVLTKPTYTGIGDIKQFGTDYMYYQISTLTKDNSIQVALLFVVLMVITTFTKKRIQLFGFHHIMHLKNGVLRDLRKTMYNKIIELPISYYSEKEKEISWHVCLGKRSAKLLFPF
jgi:subfamily B ATP-binding cassette protein MsbA